MAGAIKGIKIEFDGDTSKLSKAIKSIKSESNDLSKQIKNVNKSLKFDEGNIELIAQKMDLLSRSAEAAGLDVKNLKELQGQMDAAGVSKSSEAYRNLQQEISLAESKQKSFRQAFEDSLQTAPIEALDRQYELLEQDIADNEDEIKKLEAAMAKLDGKGTEEAQKKYVELQRKLDQTREKNEQLREDMDKINAARAAKQAAGDVEDLGEALEEAGEAGESATEAMGDGLSNVSNLIMSAGLITAVKELGAAFKDCIDASMTFESSMSKVSALSGATGGEFTALAEKAKELGASTKYTASETADAFSYMALAGWDVDSMLSGIDGTLNLAAAAEMDLATASDIVTDNLTAFGLTAADSGQFVDQMAYAMANSNTNVQQLGEAYKNVASTAKSLGFSVEDTTAAIMVMSNAGVKGGEAGTALNAVMTRLVTNTKDCADALEEYNVDVIDKTTGNMRSLGDILGDMAELWGTLGTEEQAALSKAVAGQSHYAALQTVMDGCASAADGGASAFSEYSQALANCNGSAENMADVMQDNLQGSITELESATEGLKIAIGDQLSPAMTVATDAATSLVGGLTSIVQSNSALVPVLGGVTTAFGLLATATTVAATAQKLYKQLLDTTNFAALISPIGLVTTAIGALAAGITVAISDWERIKKVQEEAAAESEVAAQKYEETVGAIGENQENVAGLCARLDELTSKTELSASEQEEAKQIVNELNNLIPNLGLSYDELANSINMSTDAIIANAKAAGNQEQITALEEKITETWKEQQVVAQDLADAKEDLADAQKELDEAEEEAKKHTNESASAQLEYKDAVNEAQAALDAEQENLDKTQAYYDELGQSMEDDAKKIKELSGEMTEATDSTEDLGNAAVKTSEEMEAEAEAAKEATQAVAKIGLACYEASGSGDELMEQFEELSKEFEANKENCDAATAALVEQKLAQLELTAMTQQLKEQLPLLGSGYEQLAASLKASGYSVDEYVASYQETFSNVVSGFDELKYNTEQGLNDWVEAMDKRVEIQEKWNGNIETLVEAANGASTIPWVTATPEFKAAVQTMMDGGMETYGTAAEELAALVEEGNANAVLEVCNGITEAGAAAQQAAKNEFAMQTGLTMEAIDSMLQSGAATIEGDKVVIQDAAAAAAAGVPDGMLETQEETDAAVQTLVSSAADAVLDGETEMAYENSGKALMQYMINGIKAKQTQVSNAIKGVLQSVGQSAKTYAQSQGKDVGYYFDVGLANGIRTNKSLVYDAAYEVAAEASTAARNAIKVESPSKVAMEIGEYFSEGMAIGITNGQDMVAKASAAMADSAAVAASSGTASAATTNNYEGHNIEIVVNAARGQDANQIADAVMDKINSALIRTRGARRL